MKRIGELGLIALLLAAPVVSAQAKPILVVDIFTLSQGVTLPYDLKLLQPKMVAELKVEIGQTFDVVSEVPKGAKSFYVLAAQIQSWKAGNGAMRFVVGLGPIATKMADRIKKNMR